MLECLKFILKLVVQFLNMLFEIDVGFTNLGIVMCVTFIFLPLMLTFINFLKRVVIDEFDDKHDFGLLFNGYDRYSKKYKPKHAKKY